MNIDVLQQIILAIINAIGIILARWVLGSDKNKRVNQSFVVMTFFILLWVNFAYFGLNTIDLGLSLVLLRLNYASVSLFLLAFYYFYVVYFLGKNNWANKIGVLLFFLSGFFFLISITSSQIIQEVVVRDWGSEIVFGPLISFFNLYSFFVALIVIIYSIRGFTELSAEMKTKLKIFVSGILIFIIGNLIFNVGTQLLFQSVRYAIFGDFSSIFFLGFTAYAIVRHELFETKVIATEAVTIFLWIILFSKLFASSTPAQLLVDIFSLLLTIIFGVFLIRSVIKEVKQRQELELLNKKMKDLDAQKDEFVSVAAHELRAPMAAIKGYISLVLEGDTGQIPDQTREFLTDAFESNDRLIRLVNNMLNVSRIEEGRLVFQMGQVNLSKVITDVYTEFKNEADHKKLDFAVLMPANIKDLVYVDKDRIYEVVSNLVSNAIKYTENGKVEIVASNPTPQTVRVEVRDTGKGISKDEQVKLFQKFQRAQSSTGKTIGTGLGLYISKLLVNKFGGKIGLVSEHGRGSNFWFEIPLVNNKLN